MPDLVIGNAGPAVHAQGCAWSDLFDFSKQLNIEVGFTVVQAVYSAEGNGEYIHACLLAEDLGILGIGVVNGKVR